MLISKTYKNKADDKCMHLCIGVDVYKSKFVKTYMFILQTYFGGNSQMISFMQVLKMCARV